MNQSKLKMKILVFGDSHGDMISLEKAKKKAEKVDLVICLGDLTLFGEDMELLLQYLNTFPKPVILLHGNHEDEDLLRIVSESFDNIKFSHAEVFHRNEFSFITYGGDGFSRNDFFFEEVSKILIEHVKDKNKTVVIFHGPPFKTKLDIPFEDHHSGNLSYRKFIEKHQPLICFSGHIHETFKQKDKIGKTILLNPGPDGEIIDLKELAKEREQKKAHKKNE